MFLNNQVLVNGTGMVITGKRAGVELVNVLSSLVCSTVWMYFISCIKCMLCELNIFPDKKVNQVGIL